MCSCSWSSFISLYAIQFTLSSCYRHHCFDICVCECRSVTSQIFFIAENDYYECTHIFWILLKKFEIWDVGAWTFAINTPTQPCLSLLFDFFFHFNSASIEQFNKNPFDWNDWNDGFIHFNEFAINSSK